MDVDVTVNRMAELLKENGAFEIYFHKKPDGDAVASAYALGLALRACGKKCRFVCHDPVPERYRFLTDLVWDDELDGGFKRIAVDSVNPKRLGKYAEIPVDFCIDHHEKNAFDQAIRYVEDQSSSCSELIFKLIEAMNVPVTKQIADFLYTGLVTDTMCFRTTGTNTQSLRTAARLAEYGADIVGLARRFCLMKSPKRMEIERILCNSFHYTCNAKVLTSMFTYEDMHRIGLDDSHLEGLNSVVDQVEDIDIAMVIRETRPKFCRVSVRTMKPNYNAADICGYFGGGGHSDRSGCEIEDEPQKVREMLEATVEKYIERNR